MENKSSFHPIHHHSEVSHDNLEIYYYLAILHFFPSSMSKPIDCKGFSSLLLFFDISHAVSALSSFSSNLYLFFDHFVEAIKFFSYISSCLGYFLPHLIFFLIIQQLFQVQQLFSRVYLFPL